MFWKSRQERNRFQEPSLTKLFKHGEQINGPENGPEEESYTFMLPCDKSSNVN